MVMIAPMEAKLLLGSLLAVDVPLAHANIEDQAAILDKLVH